MTFAKVSFFVISFFCISYAQGFYLSYDNNLQLSVNVPSFKHLYGNQEMSSRGLGSYLGLMFKTKKIETKKCLSNDILGVESVFASKETKIMNSSLSFITYTRAFNIYYMMNIFTDSTQSFYFKVGSGLVHLKTYDITRPSTEMFLLKRPFIKIGYFVFIQSCNEDLTFPFGCDIYIFKSEKSIININIFEMRVGFAYRIYTK